MSRKPQSIQLLDGTFYVICTDGSIWGRTRSGASPHWYEMDPIPGSDRANELAVHGPTPNPPEIGWTVPR